MTPGFPIMAAGDTTDTAEALIVAGRAMFARHGYDAASVRAITAAAGANLGSITYHFGSKRELYERVAEIGLRALADRVESAASAAGAPLERVEGVIRAVFDFLHENPDVPQLMLQEVTVGRAPPAAAALQIRRLHGVVARLVVAGQRDGTIRPGDPVVLAVAIVSNPVYLTLVRPPSRAWLGIELEAPASRAGMVENTVAFTCAGLASGGGGEEEVTNG